MRRTPDPRHSAGALRPPHPPGHGASAPPSPPRRLDLPIQTDGIPRMPRPLTELELEVMKAVWEVSGGTIRQVHEALSARRRIAYTTVQTMLNILVTKGHLRRDPGEGRAHVYSPVHTESRVISSLVAEFVGRVFRGSARPLVLSLVKDRRITREELDEILKAAEDAT